MRISLDDFGTGQSSLNTDCEDFILDKVKIDRAFVSASITDRASEHIVKAILAMCRLDLPWWPGIEGLRRGGKTPGRSAVPWGRAIITGKPAVAWRRCDISTRTPLRTER